MFMCTMSALEKYVATTRLHFEGNVTRNISSGNVAEMGGRMVGLMGKSNIGAQEKQHERHEDEKALIRGEKQHTTEEVKKGRPERD